MEEKPKETKISETKDCEENLLTQSNPDVDLDALAKRIQNIEAIMTNMVMFAIKKNTDLITQHYGVTTEHKNMILKNSKLLNVIQGTVQAMNNTVKLLQS